MMKSILLNNVTNSFSIPTTPSNAKICNILTKILSKRLKIIILLYILFSVILILFLEKKIKHNNPEKNIEQTGKRIPAILSPLLL